MDRGARARASRGPTMQAGGSGGDGLLSARRLGSCGPLACLVAVSGGRASETRSEWNMCGSNRDGSRGWLIRGRATTKKGEGSLARSPEFAQSMNPKYLNPEF